jgi:hypothetical protein
MAELLAVSSEAANSQDFTLTDGVTATLLLKDGTNNAVLQKGATAGIFVKTSGGAYMLLGLLSASDPMQVVAGAGTFRVGKPAGYALGVDKN